MEYKRWISIDGAEGIYEWEEQSFEAVGIRLRSRDGSRIGSLTKQCEARVIDN